MQMLRFFWDEAVALDPVVEPNDQRHMKLSRQGQLGDLWRTAGLMNVKEEGLMIDQAYSSTGSRLRKAQAPGALTSSRFRRNAANSLKLACANACFEIARMAHSR